MKSYMYVIIIKKLFSLTKYVPLILSGWINIWPQNYDRVFILPREFMLVSNV